MGCGVGFDSISTGVWLTIGCGVACDGFRSGSQWVCGVARGGGFHFLSIPMDLGVGVFVFLFYVVPNTQCKIFARAFS